MKLTTNYPSNLSQNYLKAMQMVCEGGMFRSEAAVICKVDNRTLGTLMRANGLRRAPPAHLQMHIEAILNGADLPETARSAKVSPRHMRFWVERERGEMKPGKAASAHEQGLALGLTGRQTAEKFGVSYGAIMRVAAITRRPLPKSKTGVPADAVIARYKELKSLRKTGAEFGITGARVHQIVKNNGG